MSRNADIGGKEVKKTGYLFKNKFKTDETPDAPDYSGKLEIGGSVYMVSGWLSTNKNGIPYLSLAARLKTRQTIQEKIDETNTG